MCACALVCVCVLAHMRCGHVSFVRMAHVWCGHRCLRLVRVFRVLVCGACASCVADRGCLWHMSTCMYVCVCVCVCVYVLVAQSCLTLRPHGL